MNATVGALSVTTLGVPAMLAVGLASSTHCALMCGALYARHGRRFDGAGLLGRLLAYSALGALAGGAGEWMLRAVTWTGAGQGLRLLLLPPVIWLLVRRSRSAPVRSCCGAEHGRAVYLGHARRMATGFATALVPCPLLFAAAGYAMLAADAATGAALMLAFGIGTTPAVQAGAWVWTRAAARPGWGAAVTASAAGSALLAALGAPALIGWCVG